VPVKKPLLIAVIKG